MNAFPIVVRAEYRGDFRIRLAFSDGVEGTIDFSEWLSGPVFQPLKDREYFARFFVGGGTVTWPNGADIAPETLHERAKANAAAQHADPSVGPSRHAPCAPCAPARPAAYRRR